MPRCRRLFGKRRGGLSKLAICGHKVRIPKMSHSEKHRRAACFFYLLSALCGLADSVQAAPEGSNWMTSIDDEKHLYELTIPGTHDSGAMVETVSGTAKCQDLTISEQLAAGVRSLDIRCRHINNAFAIHHGPIYQELNFDDVLNSITTFLQDNPGETVIMFLKEEYNPKDNTRSFAETFTEYVNKKPSLWSLGTAVPRLGDVRGKIVLIRRFDDPHGRGIPAPPSDWPDDTTGTIEGPPRLRIQDEWIVLNRENKWDYINTLLLESGQNPTTLYVNFASGFTLALGIPHVANYINPRVEEFFRTAKPRRYGLVIMDFITVSLARLIYLTNYPSAALSAAVAAHAPELELNAVNRTVRLTWRDWTAEPFVDTNGNGQRDGDEPFTDLDADGEYDQTLDLVSNVEVSSDLTNWTIVGHDIDGGTLLLDANNASRLFYRVTHEIPR